MNTGVIVLAEKLKNRGLDVDINGENLEAVNPINDGCVTIAGWLGTLTNEKLELPHPPKPPQL